MKNEQARDQLKPKYKWLKRAIVLITLLLVGLYLLRSVLFCLIMPRMLYLLTGLDIALKHAGGSYFGSLCLQEIRLQQPGKLFEQLQCREIRLSYNLWDLIEGRTNSVCIHLLAPRVVIKLEPGSQDSVKETDNRGSSLDLARVLAQIPQVEIQQATVSLKIGTQGITVQGLNLEQKSCEGQLRCQQARLALKGYQQQFSDVLLRWCKKGHSLRLHRLRLATSAARIDWSNLLVLRFPVPGQLEFSFNLDVLQGKLSGQGTLDFKQGLKAQIGALGLQLAHLDNLLHIGLPHLPALPVCGRTSFFLQAHLPQWQISQATATLCLNSEQGGYGSIRLNRLKLEAALEEQRLEIKRLRLVWPGEGELGVHGNIAGRQLDIRANLKLQDLARFSRYLRTCRLATALPLHGQVAVQAHCSGNYQDKLNFQVRLQAPHLGWQEYIWQNLDLRCQAAWEPRNGVFQITQLQLSDQAKQVALQAALALRSRRQGGLGVVLNADLEAVRQHLGGAWPELPIRGQAKLAVQLDELRLPGPTLAGRLQLQITQGAWGQVEFKQLQLRTTCRWQQQCLQVQDLSLQCDQAGLYLCQPVTWRVNQTQPVDLLANVAIESLSQFLPPKAMIQGGRVRGQLALQLQGGTASCTPRLTGRIKLQLSDCRLQSRALPPVALQMQLCVDQHECTLKHLQVNSRDLLLALRGKLDLVKSQVNSRLDWEAKLQTWTQFGLPHARLAGKVHGLLELQGDWQDPRLHLTLTGQTLQWQQRQLPDLQLDLHYQKARLEISRLELIHGAGKLQIQGWIKHDFLHPRNPLDQARLNVQLKSSGLDLRKLSSNLKSWCPVRIRGKTWGTLNVQGRLADPQFRGNWQVHLADLQNANWPRIAKLDLDLHLAPRQLQLRKLHMYLPSGELQLQGQCEYQQLQVQQLQLRLGLYNVDLARLLPSQHPLQWYSRANGHFVLSGRPAQPHLQGALSLRTRGIQGVPPLISRLRLRYHQRQLHLTYQAETARTNQSLSQLKLNMSIPLNLSWQALRDKTFWQPLQGYGQKWQFKLTGRRIHLNQWLPKLAHWQFQGPVSLEVAAQGGWRQARLRTTIRLAEGAITYYSSSPLSWKQINLQVQGQSTWRFPQGLLQPQSISLASAQASLALVQPLLAQPLHLDVRLERAQQLRAKLQLPALLLGKLGTQLQLQGLQGQAGLQLELSGSWSSPRLQAKLQLSKAAYAGWHVEQAALACDYANNSLNYHGRLSCAELALDTQGCLGLQLPLKPRSAWRLGPLEHSRTSLRIASLAPFVAQGPLRNSLRNLEGQVTLQLQANGPLEALNYRGMLKLDNGLCRLKHQFLKIDDGQLRIDITPQQIKITQITARVGGGRLLITGYLDMHHGRPGNLQMHLQGHELLLVRTDTVSARTDADLYLKGRLVPKQLGSQRLLVLQGKLSGDITVTEVNIKHNLKLEDLTVTAERASQAPGIEADNLELALDLNIKIKKVYFDSPLAEVECAGDLHIGATAREPEITGAIRVVYGKIVFTQGKLDIEDGVIVFKAQDPLVPYLRINATTNIRQWKIIMAIKGPPHAIIIRFSSIGPPLSQEDILILLLTGLTKKELEEKLRAQGSEDGSTMETVKAKGIELLAQQVLDYIGIGELISAEYTTSKVGLGVKLWRGFGIRALINREKGKFVSQGIQLDLTYRIHFK